MFQFVPRSDEELDALRSNLDAGIYRFKVDRWALSKSLLDNTDQTEITLLVYREDGSNIQIKAWFSSKERDLPRIKGFLVSINRTDLWIKGIFDPSLFIGCEGYAKTDKNKKGYPIIKSFLSQEDAKAQLGMTPISVSHLNIAVPF